MAVAVFAVAVVTLGGLVIAGAVPESLAERLTGFSLSERSAWERIAWTRDAFEIVKDYPYFGIGGGGWASIYFQYQSYGYFTREVHNDLMEIWVETGTVGLLAFLALIGATAFTAVRLARRARGGGGDPGLAPAVAGVTGAAALLVAHSCLDFNLALGCVGIFLWALLGVIDGLRAAGAAPAEKPARAARRRSGPVAPGPRVVWPRVGILVVAAGVSFLAVFLASGVAAAGRAQALFQDLKLDAAHAAYTRACEADPWSAGYRMRRASLCETLYKAKKEPQYITEARAMMEEAIDLDPHNPNHHALYGALALRYGGWDVAKEELRKALELQPFEAKRYAQLAEVHYLLGRNDLLRNDVDKAREELEQSVAVLDLLEAQAAKVFPLAPENLTLPSPTPMVALHAGQSLCLLGRYDEATPLLEFAHTSGLVGSARETQEEIQTRQAEAALWLALVAEVRGDAEAAALYIEAARPVVLVPEMLMEQVRPLMGKAGG